MLDPRVASVLDQTTAADDQDEDALVDRLEDDEAPDAYREQRLQQLHSELARAKQMRNNSHGSYAEIKDEKTLMDLTTSTKLCVVHFSKPDFPRCRVMDSHLECLAPLHLDTRFVRIDVEHAPFLVVKLKVQVLPCVIAFVDGISADRIVGFEGVGQGTDRFTTRELEARLLQCNVLMRPKVQGHSQSKLSFSPFNDGTSVRKGADQDDDDDDDDWD